MFIFAVSIFLSAFLLFQVQPMIGKVLLPWFGGTPAVWTTVMLFFQILLTGGYAYSYWLAGRKGTARQSAIHIALVALAMTGLTIVGLAWESPFTPNTNLKPQDISTPILYIFRLLIISVGLPYFVLASNGPLMQAWFGILFPERSYARLYALSNAGSLLGLITYPILIEPYLSLKIQGWVWYGAFLAFGVLAIWISVKNRQAQNLEVMDEDSVAPAKKPPASVMTLWVILSATASLMLLSVTSQISQEVAVIPFLWILPLMLYLLTFILAFSGDSGYQRKVFAGVFGVSLIIFLYVLLNLESTHIYLQIFAYCLLMFSACMLCHGELYLLRPSAHYLTSFYLMISVGGALGGLFTSLLAPQIFNGYWEFVIAFAMAVALWLIVLRPTRIADHLARTRFLVTIFILGTLVFSFLGDKLGMLYAQRNFYGVVRVNLVTLTDQAEPAYQMAHGITLHGLQFTNPNLKNIPTSYFVDGSGVSLALQHHPRAGQGLKVGVLGLGVGTLAVYGQPGDEYRFYEINSIVIDLAEGLDGYFSYLQDSPADITTIPGDARNSLEQELATGDIQDFDVLVLDAFSSDSVPMHLLTREAFDLYLQHSKTDAIIAANITNRHIDLEPVFWKLAEYYELYMIRISHPGNAIGGRASDWLLLARNPELLQADVFKQNVRLFDDYLKSIPLWTDDYSNLFQILK